MEVAGPLGTPLGLAQWKRASARGEAGTSGFLSVSDSDRSLETRPDSPGEPGMPRHRKMRPFVRYSVSREVPRSILKCETVLGTLDATPKVPRHTRLTHPFSSGSSQPRDRTQVSRIAGGFFIPGLRRSPGEGNSNLTPVFLPGKSHGQRSLAGYSPWGRKELDTTDRLCCRRRYC